MGKETAVALATRGARIIVACRDPEKARRAVTEIRLQSRSLNVCHMDLDLANLSSVRGFCKDFLQKEKRLDILINCAGEPASSPGCCDRKMTSYVLQRAPQVSRRLCRTLATLEDSRGLCRTLEDSGGLCRSIGFSASSASFNILTAARLHRDAQRPGLDGRRLQHVFWGQPLGSLPAD